MSNTSSVTPYESGSSGGSIIGGIAGACVVGLTVGTVSLVKWLAKTTEEEKTSLKKIKAERMQEMINGNSRLEKQNLKSIELHMRNIDSLVLSAQKMGYHSGPLSNQPQVLLSHPSGDRMAITRQPNGRLVVHTVGDLGSVHSLVRQHTVDRAIEHLARKGMEVKAAPLANGEVQILAREKNPNQLGGAAEVKAQVRRDGTAWVDIERIKGNRCEQIVSELAQAVGGKATQTKKKESYYQLPGEPARIKVGVQ